jgi:hypothetical protein
MPHTSVPLDEVASFCSVFLFFFRRLFYFSPPAEATQSLSYGESIKQFLISLN